LAKKKRKASDKNQNNAYNVDYIQKYIINSMVIENLTIQEFSFMF